MISAAFYLRRDFIYTLKKGDLFSRRPKKCTFSRWPSYIIQYILMILATSLRIFSSLCSSMVATTVNHYANSIFPIAIGCKFLRVLHTRDVPSHRNVVRSLISRIPILKDHGSSESDRYN
jgi:di/tricarboxylate transporter